MNVKERILIAKIPNSIEKKKLKGREKQEMAAGLVNTLAGRPEGRTPSKTGDRRPSPAYFCLPTFFSWMQLKRLRIILFTSIQK
jgi:hypothetical protein